jgi:glycosyltransferase involved in cell wall biosynthesis
LKLLLFTNSLGGGGAERAAATLANFWAHQNWEVTVVTLCPQSDDFYEVDGRVRRIALNLAGESRNVVHGLLQNLRRALALRKILRQLRPAVALSLMSTPNVLLALAARGLPGLATVGSERDYPPHAPLGALWSRLRSTMYGQLGAVVVLTHETARWMQRHSCARRVAVIPNAAVWPLPVQAPMISPQSVLAPGRKVLLAVGRLAQVKNFAVLLDTFAQLAGRHHDWDLVMLGEGPERASLEAQVARHALTQRVFMPGIAGNVGAWYAHADLYVMTSRSEGFPNTLAEALSHGLPAVSVDCDTGPRDIIRHDIDGVLVPPDDTSALARALDRLMGNADLRAAFGARAQEARQRFSIEQITTRWEALFSDLLSRQAASPAMRATSTANR